MYKWGQKIYVRLLALAGGRFLPDGEPGQATPAMVARSRTPQFQAQVDAWISAWEAEHGGMAAKIRRVPLDLIGEAVLVEAAGGSLVAAFLRVMLRYKP